MNSYQSIEQYLLRFAEEEEIKGMESGDCCTERVHLENAEYLRDAVSVIEKLKEVEDCALILADYINQCPSPPSNVWYAGKKIRGKA